MSLLNLLALSPLTGDESPKKNVIVLVVFGLAAVAAVVLGLFAGKGKK